MPAEHLRVLIVHSAYQQRGGEDSVVEAETALLRKQGHQVAQLLRHNDEVKQLSLLDVAAQTMWSRVTTQQVREQVAAFKPDVIHVHNTLPLVSPSVFWAAAQLGVPVVQTLHNFRMLCPQATFLREGRVCEDCMGKLPWPAVVHRCYRESAVQTGAVAVMLALHRGMGTYRDKVTRYIALNAFCKAKFVEGGLAADRIDIKPNFVDWVPTPQWEKREGGLYIGRLSVEKGVQVLMQAMRLGADHRLQVIGSGPFETEMRDVAGAAYVGSQTLDEIMARLSRAAYLVLPSVCYEGFPRTLVEAFANGVPVIASRHGSLEELVRDGQTGLLCEPGHAQDLLDKIRWADAHPQEMRRMGMAAREEYEQRYTPERNGEQLITVYRRAMRDVSASKLGTGLNR